MFTDILLMKLNNCTLLDDVEAPSRMWENTICGEIILQTSPVKLIGLLRPSTIIEEAPDDSTNSEVSSQMSFRTATKRGHSDVSSSAYETAHDSTVASSRTDFSNKSRHQELEVIDVDDMLLLAIEKNEQKAKENDESESASIPIVNVLDATIVDSVSANAIDTCNAEDDISMDLIDLEKTFGPLHDSPHSSILVDDDDAEAAEDEERSNVKQNEIEVENDNISDDSIIEILSDDEDDNVNETEDVQDKDDLDCNKEQLLCANIKMESSSIQSSSYSINQDTYSFNESLDNDKENCGENNEASEKSMQFNDTMEEVEYMLKKGMEYMAAEAASKKSPVKVKPTVPATNSIKVSKTQPNSPMTHKKTTSNISSSASKGKLYDILFVL